MRLKNFKYLKFKFNLDEKRKSNYLFNTYFGILIS